MSSGWADSALSYYLSKVLVELPFQIVFPCAMVSQAVGLGAARARGALLLPLPPPLLVLLLVLMPVITMVVLSRWGSAVPIRSEQR